MPWLARDASTWEGATCTLTPPKHASTYSTPLSAQISVVKHHVESLEHNLFFYTYVYPD